MKYMIIIYGNRALWESYPPDEWRERIAESIAAAVPAATMSQVEVWPVRHEAGR